VPGEAVVVAQPAVGAGRLLLGTPRPSESRRREARFLPPAGAVADEAAGGPSPGTEAEERRRRIEMRRLAKEVRCLGAGACRHRCMQALVQGLHVG
jgi:hypothetical protein